MAELAEFFAREPVVILVELTGVRGSSPRSAGTFMLVGADSLFGTIGGGALEYLVIDHARRLIANGRASEALDIPLGPEIGQCCGGRVEVRLALCDRDVRAEIAERVKREMDAWPDIFVFGAGHVGRALARCLSLLPVRAHIVDTRRGVLGGLPENVTAEAVPMPEAVVRAAPAGSSFVIVTHDHALDFLIAQEALRRADAPYVGMVGSQSKRARFGSWYRGEGGTEEALDRLILPIGAQGLGDKRPEVIAALATAEIMVEIGRLEDSGSRVSATKHVGAVDGR